MSRVIAMKDIDKPSLDCVRELIAAMNKCLQEGIGFEAFSSAIEHLDENDSTDLLEALGIITSYDWVEELGSYMYCFTELYDDGTKQGVTRFITLTSHSFVTIVAICGDPGAEMIEKEFNSLSKQGFRSEVNWPDNLRNEGAQIDEIYFALTPKATVTMRDGSEIKVN